MNRTRLLMILLVGLLVLFMLGGFGSSAKTSKPRNGTPQPRAGNRLDEQNERNTEAQSQDSDDEQDPDLPPGTRGSIDKETYLRLRDESIALRRGMEPGRPFDPRARGRAIERMERQEDEVNGKNSWLGSVASLLGFDLNAGPTWTAIGPSALPNGNGVNGSTSVTGRATSVAVDPTNSSRVYLGTAQGGVWRSLDGGNTWTNIFDSAQSLAIGALAVAPSDPSKVYVGTGEANQSSDSFFGVGLYRIDNAFTSADLVGPINPPVTTGLPGTTSFTGRGITKILVHPTNADIIFVTTAGAAAGAGGNTLTNSFPPLALRGLYRSTNATATAGLVGFTRLTVTTAGSVSPDTGGNRAMFDMVFDPADPNVLICAVQGQASGANDGGIYRSTNALSPTPTFTQTLQFGLLADGSFIRSQLAINRIGSTVTVYAATGEASTSPSCSAPSTNFGVVRKSTDGGVSWSAPLAAGQGFCGGQCSYDIPIAVSPLDPNIVYIGGQVHGTCSDGIKRSADGGITFSRDDNNLHADSHAIFIDPLTNPVTVFTANDGGIWKRPDASPGAAWTNLNRSPLNTLQFQSLAIHPTDANLTIGGTQDNGTELQTTTSGSWTNIRVGDGGYTLIDQNATDTTNVTMYHTFFFSTGSQIRYERASTVGGGWTNIGCTGGTPANGINCTDNVLFYAPMALGPGNPNTVYLGTDRLYRSSDRGITNVVVSQASITNPSGVGAPISTIAISPQDDNYRLVGLQNGRVWATSTGSSTLIEVSPSFPANPNGSTNKFVGRAIIDPNNKNVAYVALSYFAPAGQGIWKITNLGAAAGSSPVAPVWSAAGNGIPSIPINAFAVDPQNSNNLFAGTDIGVYFSTDAGANWAPFGNGLPRVAIFDMKIQDANRILRVATHGRGMWEASIGAASPSPTPTPTPSPTPAPTPFPPPVLFVEDGTANKALAIDSVTFVRGPFTVAALNNFSSDQHTRVIIFTTDLGLSQPDSSVLTVKAGTSSLTVENVGTLSGVIGLSASYIVVRLPDGLPTGDLPVVVTWHGVASSNSPLISISP